MLREYLPFASHLMVALSGSAHITEDTVDEAPEEISPKPESRQARRRRERGKA